MEQRLNFDGSVEEEPCEWRALGVVAAELAVRLAEERQAKDAEWRIVAWAAE